MVCCAEYDRLNVWDYCYGSISGIRAWETVGTSMARVFRRRLNCDLVAYGRMFLIRLFLNWGPARLGLTPRYVWRVVLIRRLLLVIRCCIVSWLPLGIRRLVELWLLVWMLI